MGLADRRRARVKVMSVVRTVKREMMKMLNLRWALAKLAGRDKARWMRQRGYSKPVLRKERVYLTRMDNEKANHPGSSGSGPEGS